MSDFEAITPGIQKSVAKANASEQGLSFSTRCQRRNYTRVTVEFDGCGDSGQIESVTAYARRTPIDFPAATVALHATSWNQP